MQSKDKWFIIANPNSGGNATEEEWGYIHNYLTQRQCEFRVKFTTYAGHASELITKAIEDGYRKVIVAGGDGTYNEVLNGLFNQKMVETQEVLLTLLPLGTGNDWARMMKIPLDWQQAIDLLTSGKEYLQDVGRASFFHGKEYIQRFFLNVAGMGFDAFVAQKYLSQKGLGKYSYFTGLLRGLLNYELPKVRIEVEDRIISTRIFTVAVAICKYYGAGMKIAPSAIANDGLFDVSILGNLTKMEAILELRNLYNGTFVKHPKVETLRCSSIRISSEEDVFLQMDGELIGQTPVQFDIIPASLRVIVPKGYK